MSTRVLEILATLKRAGAERTAVTLASRLDRARFTSELISLYDAFPGGFEPELAAAGVPVRHLGKRRGLDPRMYPRLVRVFRDFKPDVIHTHSYVLRYAWPVLRYARPACNSAMVHTVHNLAGREVDLSGRLLHRWAMRRGVRFVAIGQEVAASFRDCYGRDPAAVISNGIEPASPQVPRAEWRAAHGFSPDAILIASVARLDPQKNPLMLLRALPDVPNCHLLLAGQGSLAGELKTAAGDRVHLIGLRQDVPDLLHACDIFALASDYEGLPIAVIEAMAAGLPIVSTAAGGLRELVESGVTGLLVPPGDGAALREALRKLVFDAHLRRSMGARGAVRAQHFSATQMVESYAAFFSGLAGAA